MMLTLGSSTAITCVLLARLGLRTAMAALVGDDDHGRFCRDALATEGVDTGAVRTDPVHPTGLTIAVAYPADRLLLTRPGTMARFGFADIDLSLLTRARHLHVGSFYLQDALRPDLPRLFARARAAKLTTSLDTGWDPGGAWRTDMLAEVLPLTDVFLPNETEVARLTGAASLDDGIARLQAMGAREIAVKRGANGAALAIGAEILAAPGLAVTPVDTTGAGDAFNAGYLFGRLDGRAPCDRLRLANACGALTATARGGTGGLTGLPAAEALMAQGRPD